jgi:NAD+ synthase
VLVRKIDIRQDTQRIEEFIREYCQKSGFNKLILGLSGGIDSALSAALAVRAVGKENVHALMLPSRDSNPDSEGDAIIVAKALGIKYEIREIGFLVEDYFSHTEKKASALRIGNWKARCRMMLLYDLSAKLNALVVGTSNRTELLVGYFTQHGDGACALEPIGHLYKTEVRQMAQYLGLPQCVIDKAPTADLWEGQTDEAELGITYPELDEILYLLTEESINIHASENLPYPKSSFEHVLKLMKSSEYKRKLPPILD